MANEKHAFEEGAELDRTTISVLIFQCYLVSVDSFMRHDSVFFHDDGFHSILNDFFS